MLIVFLCLTKPAFMRRPWRITPCPAIHGWAFLCFLCIILQYLTSFASRLHEGVPSPGYVPGLPVLLRCDWIFICVGSYSAAEQDNHFFIFLQALYNFFHQKEIVQGFLMYNEFDHEAITIHCSTM